MGKNEERIRERQGAFASHNSVFIIGLVITLGVVFFFGTMTMFTYLTLMGFSDTYVYIILVALLSGITFIIFGIYMANRNKAKECATHIMD